MDGVSLCSPNDLHDAHVRFALRFDADAKPGIEIVSDIRRSKAVGLRGDYHPLLKKHL